MARGSGWKPDLPGGRGRDSERDLYGTSIALLIQSLDPRPYVVQS